jgi:hypothetical protein
LNIDISNANCGRGHSPDHACLRVGFLAIAELSFGALGRRRGDVLTGVPTLRRLKSRPRCATVRGPFRVPADAVALSGGSSHPSSADGRWLGRSLCSLDLVASSAFGTSLWPPLPCGSAVTHGRCSAARPGEEAAGPAPVSPPRAGWRGSDRPRSLKPVPLLFPLPRSSGGSPMRKSQGERRPKTYFYVDLRSDGATR